MTALAPPLEAPTPQRRRCSSGGRDAWLLVLVLSRQCGATMYVAPIGIVSAGNPEAAYAEAIDVAGAHQSSHGRGAAGVFAAAVAEAMGPGADVDSVVQAALRLAKDGTENAIAATGPVIAAAVTGGPIDAVIDALLAFALTRGGGDFARTITLAVSGSWDTDSFGATAGALIGARALPPEWIDPLDDRLATSVPGLAGARFTAFAIRTVEVSA